MTSISPCVIVPLDQDETKHSGPLKKERHDKPTNPRIMNITTKPSEVAFLLGAGASIHAGVPGTYAFVNLFIEDISDPKKRNTVEEIVRILKQWKKSDIDIELLLETLVNIKLSKDEPLLQFCKDNNLILDNFDESLIDDLKNFIKRKCIVSKDKIRYLAPFLHFVQEFNPLDIFSVNYDICIEQFCDEYKIAYQDGFDVYWNPKTFQAEHIDIRLYKLHGSAMWYQSDRGSYIKIPIMTDISKIELITGEKAENLILYPMRKWEYAEPLLELLIQMKHLLESEECHTLIVVGYSFRDIHIKRIIWDSARRNTRLRIIIVDPYSLSISKRLIFYDETSQIPSSLYGRIICLPYKFEKVFPKIKNHYLRYLGDGLVTVAGIKQKILKGEIPNWEIALQPFLESEYASKCNEIREKSEEGNIHRNHLLQLEFPLKMSVHYLLGSFKNNASKYINEFYKNLRDIMIARMNTEIITSTPQKVKFYFNCNKASEASYRDISETLIDKFENYRLFCESRRFLAEKDYPDNDKLINVLRGICEYLKAIGNEMEIGAYLKLRHQTHKVESRRLQKIVKTDALYSECTITDPKRAQDLIKDLESYILLNIISP